MSSSSIIIPNYNGLSLLQRCIPSLLDALKHDGGAHEIIVVDNGSTDDSAGYLQQLGAPVQALVLKENIGFARACNVGAAAAQHETLVFLNNDMYFDPQFLGPLLTTLQQYPEAFAVSSRMFDWENRFQLGRVMGRFILGSFQIEADRRQYERLCYTLYTSGAISAVDRARFQALGGFDESLYVYEDVDLGYRAWKRGWVVCHEPRSVVYHKGRATSKALFSHHRYLAINLKNRFCFMWKNLTDPDIERRYWRLLPLSLAYLTVRMHSPAPLLAFRDALKERKHFSQKREQEKQLAVRTDREILQFVKDHVYVTG